MVLDITVAPVTEIVDDAADAYTVHVESHRILSVATESADVTAKWLKDVLKSSAGDKNSAIVVAVKAEENGLRYTSKGLSDDPYDLITINVGSHCLLYSLPYKYYPWDDGVPRSLTDFFGNPRVFTVGVGMAEVSRKLKSHHGLEIRNAVDVNDLAVKGSEKDVRDRLDLGRYDLGKLAMAVLGRRMEVDLPESIEWFGGGPYNWDYTLTEEKVKFTTVETFLSHLIGSKFADAMDGVTGLKKKLSKKKSKKHGKSGGGADESKGFVLYDRRYGLPLCSY